MKRLLIIDDDIKLTELLSEYLGGNQFDISHLLDGENALDEIQTRCPDLIILDYMMPGKDGIEVCRLLREVETSAPPYVILVTSRDSREDIVRGLDAGADDYLVKPVNGEELRARIEVGRRIRELQKSLAEKEKIRGALELAEQVCHEMNQPMQVVSGTSEMMLMDIPDTDPLYKKIKRIKTQVDIMGEITRKLMGIAKF